MGTIAKRGLIGLVVLCAMLAFGWFAFPRQTAGVLLQLNNASAGLAAKTVPTEIGEVHYLEGGEGETLLLIHGIYARKEHWVEMARPLVGQYRVVILDLPGFGDNAKLFDEQYDLAAQTANLRTVMDALGLARAHIAANSMGAYVATLLAASDPERVSSLAFIGSPLGVPTPIQSDMDVARANGERPLVVQSEADFAARNAWLSPDIPYVPGPILALWMQAEVATADHNRRIWDVVHHQSDVPSVLDLAPELTMPSLVVWCSPDRIFHVSGARVLTDRLPDATLATLDGCGHLPMLDRPGHVADLYLDFLQGHGAG